MYNIYNLECLDLSMVTFTNFDLVDLMVDSDWSKIEFMNLDVIAI